MELVRVGGDMRYKVLLLSVFIALGINAYAQQEVADSVAFKNVEEKQVDPRTLFSNPEKKAKADKPEKPEKPAKSDQVAKADVDWAAKVDSLTACLASRDSVIRSYKSRIASDSVAMKVQDDSLIARASRIKEWEDRRGRLDTCMISLANRWLFVRFNKEEIDKAITYFERVTSTQLKEDRKQILELLKEYEESYNIFKNILLKAQNDELRTNPFAVKEYKESYINALREMAYYKKYYKSGWSIRYLDGMITKAIEKLEKHSEAQPVDFSDLFIIEQKIPVDKLV